MRTTVLKLVVLAVSCTILFARGDANGSCFPHGFQGAATPSVNLVPDRLHFGNQVVGRRSKSKRITVSNTGGRSLYISSVTRDGDNWSDFSVVNDTCTGATIAPNRACIIDVTVNPSDTEERNARLKLVDNAPDSPQSLGLKANGINSDDVPPFVSRYEVDERRNERRA
jgi:hypothetical protein